MRRWTIVVILTLLLALSACGGTATTGDGPEVATPEGAPTPTEGVRDLPEGDAAAMAGQALTYLSTQTGIALTDIRLVSAEAQEWPNSALGCPSMDPATSYMAVVTPGYLVVAEAGGETFNLHTNEDFSIVVLCEDGHPAGEGEGGASGSDLFPTLAGELLPVATAARDTLMQESGLSAEGLALTQIDEVVWPDSAIGCPKEGEMALQVLTNGFRMIFEAAGERHFVHTNEDGSNVVVCGEEVPLPTDTTNPDS